MAEEQKETQGKSQGCCAGMPFADMMRKMREGKQEGTPFNCAEIMGKMMEEKKAGSFNCAEMMSKMMEKCCGAGKGNEEKETA